MSKINDEYAIKLLRVQFETTQRLRELSDIGVEIDGLAVSEEIVEIILDSYGFPRDNTPTQSREPEKGQPVFCRDFVLDPYYDLVEKGTDEEFQSVLNKWKEFESEKGSFYWSEEKHH